MIQNNRINIILIYGFHSKMICALGKVFVQNVNKEQHDQLLYYVYQLFLLNAFKSNESISISYFFFFYRYFRNAIHLQISEEIIVCARELAMQIINKTIIVGVLKFCAQVHKVIEK